MSVSGNLRRYWGRGLVLGVLNALLLSAIMVPAFQAGLPPMPKPPSLAFAETLVGESVPLFVGILLHVAYVAFWSLVYVVAAHPRLTLVRALALGLFLWVVILVAFFPVVGWGWAGLAVGPKVTVASLIPHLLFALFLWGLAKAFFQGRKGG
jgi:hypothetical protein